jgi:oligopeptide/dipeptide ABC transporter ATP-binding protein
LTLDPKLILADEPVSALDVSIQAQILNLLKDLQLELGISYLFIAHDIHVIFFISHRIMVMYLGEVVETGSKEQLKTKALHPYTQTLLKAVPKLDPEHRQSFVGIEGEVPSLLNPPQGCAFHPRCPKAENGCKIKPPRLRELAPGHHVACHLA